MSKAVIGSGGMIRMSKTDPTITIQVQHDGPLSIATGKSRLSTKWRNREITWAHMLQKLSETIRTPETEVEYRKMSKAKKDDTKDVGGFVGGVLQGGRRKRDAVSWRHILTLDADYVKGDLMWEVDQFQDYAAACYSTHSHTSEAPRIRLVIPLARPVTPDEYQAISRKIAEQIHIDWFDDTTYEPHRLMFWPSSPRDAEYLFKYVDREWLDPDSILDLYDDWTDPAEWPESSRQRENRQRMADQQGNPTEKAGMVGAFCRTYSIPEAIKAFLPDVYTPVDDGTRYTYTDGSTSGGLVLYQEGLFAYSHHATDPCGGRLVNAFDLVRLHKYGARDDDVSEDVDITDRPSHQAMLEWCSEDDHVKRRLTEESLARAGAEFDVIEDDEDPDAWMTRIERNKQGIIRKSITNVLTILRHDPRLKDIAYNEQENMISLRGKVPWRDQSEGYGSSWTDSDDAELRVLFERDYGLQAPTKLMDGLSKVAWERRYHPIRSYLRALPRWDGLPRVEHLLVDYLGAHDSLYVREVTKKTLVAAVARVFRPGIKFDYMLVLSGPQGVGKSTLFQRLGGTWFNDSLGMQDTKDKTGAEKLQGYWILEIGELAGIRKVEVESVKSFLSRQEDIYRPAYGRRTLKAPRQCIIVGSTNADMGFLRDSTGNRRFWPVHVRGVSTDKAPWNMSQWEVGQVWAEAVQLYEAGETLYLQGEAAEMAIAEQVASMEADDRVGMVESYLDMILPLTWYEMSLSERRSYLDAGEDFGQIKPSGSEGLERTRACVLEIWCECFGKRREDITRRDQDEIHNIMRQVDGWERHSKGNGRLRFPVYGPQRAYIRSE